MGFFSSLFGGSKLTVDGATAVQMVKDGAQLVDVRQKHERKGGHARCMNNCILCFQSSIATTKALSCGLYWV